MLYVADLNKNSGPTLQFASVTSEQTLFSIPADGIKLQSGGGHYSGCHNVQKPALLNGQGEIITSLVLNEARTMYMMWNLPDNIGLKG